MRNKLFESLDKHCICVKIQSYKVFVYAQVLSVLIDIIWCLFLLHIGINKKKNYVSMRS